MTMHLAVALEGAGWHGAAWRAPGARPAELFSASYWIELAREAERGCLDFLTIEDSLAMQSAKPFVADDRTDQVRGRPDAVLVASLLAPLTDAIGLVPTVGMTHTEPFHVAIAIATLDHASAGRAGWRAQLSARPDEAALVGRRAISDVEQLFDEAADVVEVVRALWDSWEDDAIIRDVATGRFVDRDRLHYVDFAGRWFSVKGPSIVPRSPQGQPVVVALAHSTVPYEFAARSADVVFITPRTDAEVVDLIGQVRQAEHAVGRAGRGLLVFADVVVFLDEDAGVAQERKERLDALDGRPYRSDALIFTGPTEALAERLRSWQALGLDGFRLRPGVLPHDLVGITRGLVRRLQATGEFRTAYGERTLRARLGFDRPRSRYAAEVTA